MSKKKKIIMIVSIIVAVVLIALTAVLLLVLGSKKDDNNKKIDPTIDVRVTQSSYYADNYLSTVGLYLADGSTKGTVSWVSPNTELVVGTHEYEWKFVPEDSERFNEKTGKVFVTALNQTIVSLEIKTMPTKLSGYQAYQTIDLQGIVLKVTYDSGNVNERSDNILAIYKSKDSAGNPYDSFRFGDTGVTLSYKGNTVELMLTSPVEKCQVETPKQKEAVYTGAQQQVEFESSSLYLLVEGTNLGLNAGNDYQAKFNLTDTENCVWKATGNIDELSVPFEIKKAEQVITENNYVGAYDGNSHYSSIISNISTDIYYSFDVLNANNYLTDGTLDASEVCWTNVAEEKIVYYFAVGNSNFNDKAGTIKIVITKATPTLILQNSFAISTGSKVQLSEDFVKAIGAKNEQINISGLVSFAYYTSYVSESENTKTNASNSGAETEGGAPKNKGNYYVVATFAGNETYLSKQSEQQLLVIGDAPSGYYGATKLDLYWTSGNAEGSATNQGTVYFFEKMVNPYFKAFAVESTISGLGNGLISYIGGKYILTSTNGKKYSILINNAKDEISIVNVDSSTDRYTISKFEVPMFIGEYQATSKVNSSKTDTLKIYVDNGVIYFEMNYYDGSDRSMKVSETSNATVSYGINDDGARLTFTYVTESGQKNFMAYYYSESKTIKITTFIYPKIVGTIFSLV